MKTEIKKNSRARTRKGLGLGWVMAGMVFLANPTINIIDPLPDFIGLLMIAYGLSAAAVFAEQLRSARRSFLYLALASAAKSAVCLALPYTTDNFKILMAFSFAVIEAMLFIPAVNRMLDGLTYAGMRLDSDAPFYLTKKNGKKKPVGTLRVWSVVSFIVRAAGSVLPVVPVLMLYETRGFVGSANSVNPTEFTNIYYLLCAVLTLAVGIPWLVKMLRYLGGIRRDKPFCDKLFDIYKSEYLSDSGKVAATRMKAAMIFAIIGACLCFDMYFDGINILPDAAASLFFAAALVLMIPYGKKLSVCGIVSASVWCVCSVAVELLESRFAANHYTAASIAHGIGKAGELYAPVRIAALVETLFFAFTLLLFALTLKSALTQHIPLIKKLETEQYHTAPKSEAYSKLLDKTMIYIYAAAALSVITSAVYPLIFPIAPAFWIVKGAFSLALAFVLFLRYGELCESIYTRLQNRM